MKVCVFTQHHTKIGHGEVRGLTKPAFCAGFLISYQSLLSLCEMSGQTSVDVPTQTRAEEFTLKLLNQPGRSRHFWNLMSSSSTFAGKFQVMIQKM